MLRSTCKGREEEKEREGGLHVIQNHPLLRTHNMFSYNL